MAIRIIEGKIGSGKTYYAVYHIMNNYFYWNSVSDSWCQKETDKELQVYTNISNMKLGQNLDNAISEAGTLKDFFNLQYQKKFCENRNVIYVIDEAQQGCYFHRKFYDVTVFLFFQMHRHLGVDIYLITQDSRCLARELRELAEYEIKSIRRSNSIGKSFTYKFYSGDECFKTKRISKDKKIFSLYKSMSQFEGEKIKRIPYKHMIYFLLFIFGAGIFLKFGFFRMLHSMNRKSVSPPIAADFKKNVIPDSVIDSGQGHTFKISGIVKTDTYVYYVVNTLSGIQRIKANPDEIKSIGDTVEILNISHN